MEIMEIQIQRGCGLDVHQATVVAGLLIVLGNEKAKKQIRKLGTYHGRFSGAGRVVESEGCTHVAMESTGVYGKPVYAILEILEGDFEIIAADAQRLRTSPGARPTSRMRRANFATCSPCTREYGGFRKEFQRGKRLRALGAIAAVVLAVIAGWLALGKFGSRGESWRQVSLDLSGHEAFRGAGAPKTAPLELARGRLELTLDLPTGSEPGDYDVQLTQGTSQPVAMASARAGLVDGVAVLKVRIDLGKANVGPASLLVRRSGQSWAAYALLLK